MKKLTTEQISTLEMNLFNKGRDIDVALFNVSNGGDKEFVADALSLYVNKDGGFGQGLYIDNYNPNSTAFTTYYALKLIYLYKLDDVLAKAMQKKAFTYLYHKAYQEKNIWRKGEPLNNNFAHHDDFSYPSRESLALTSGIIGLTLLMEDKTSPYYKLAINRYNLLKLALAEYDFQGDEVVELAILIAGLKKASIDVTALDKLEEKLSLENIIEVNDYVEINQELLEEALDRVVDSILPVGMWENRNKWNNKYPEGDVAEIKWMGAISAQNFYYLKKYSR